jgi:RNA polymerase sigma-70 factor (ECF subfamily)
LRRLGRGQESRAAYDQVIELAGNTAETAYLPAGVTFSSA